MTADERVGTILVIYLMLKTKSGAHSLGRHFQAYRISITSVVDCLRLMLAYGRWSLSHNSTWHVQRAPEAISSLLESIQMCFRRDSGDGWALPKFHLVATSARDIRSFGAGEIFTGQNGESKLKFVLKNPAHMTQKHPAKLSVQVAARLYEKTVIEHAYNSFMPQTTKPMIDVVEDNDTPSGEFTIRLDYDNSHAGSGCDIIWKNRNRAKKETAIHPLFINALKSFHSIHRTGDEVELTGYTQVTVSRNNDMVDGKFVLRASENYRGGRWYDFALLDQSHLNQHFGNLAEEFTCPCQVLGFVKHHIPGTPTPDLIEDAHRPDAIRDNLMVDDDLYAVVHAAEDWMSYRQLRSELVENFSLGDLYGQNSTLYITSVDHLVAPLSVLPNIGGTRRSFLAILPCRHWCTIFSDFIERLSDDDYPSESDENDEGREGQA